MRRTLAFSLLLTIAGLYPVAATTIRAPDNLGTMTELSDSIVFAEAMASYVVVSPTGAPSTVTPFLAIRHVGGQDIEEL